MLVYCVPQYFKRARPASGVLECGNIPTVVFLTVCSKNRRKWLANPTVHRLRTYEGAEDRLTYVRMNPVRGGLVKSPEEMGIPRRDFQVQVLVVDRMTGLQAKVKPHFRPR